jgi:hypothetical protein
MTSQVLDRAIDKLDAVLAVPNSTISQRVSRVLNDIAAIERVMWKKGDSTQHLMHVEDLISKARIAVGA